MSKRKKIRDELEARRCLLAVEAEGGHIGTWARAHGIDGRSPRAWQVNLARRGTKASGRRRRTQAAQVVTANGLVELVPTALARMAPSSRTGRYILEVGGARVEFGDDFSEPTLRRIVGILRSC